MNNLLIVESPNKAKSIRKYLGPDWIVEASVGHICDLPEKEMGVAPGSYALSYVISDGKDDVVRRLKQAARVADAVYLATDPDREGEAIAWHLERILGLKNPHRVMFEEVTEKACRAAVKTPTRTNMALVRAQEARRCLDRLVGFRVSPALNSKSGQYGLSAGRVQTPGVGLVVTREDEIAAFKSTQHFGVTLTFDEGGGHKWTAEWITEPFRRPGERFLLDADLARRISGLRVVTTQKCDEKETFKAPPPAFSTSTLIQAAAQKLKLRPKETAEVSQELFHKGLITYHRTDSQNLKPDTIELVRAYAARNGLDVAPEPRTVKEKAGVQGAHEAIRATSCDLADATTHPDADKRATAKEQRLYALIRERAIASQLASAVYDVRTLLLLADIEIEKTPVHFAARGSTLKSKGFLALTDGDEDATQVKKEDPEAKNPVPALKIGAQRTAIAGKLNEKKTEPPLRYTQATLVKALEDHGIGRPSSFASIIEVILKKFAVVGPDEKLRPTPTGVGMFKSVAPIFSFAELSFTKAMELAIDDIATDKVSYRDVVALADSVLDKELAKFSVAQLHESLRVESSGPCPVCVARNDGGRVGEIIKRTRRTLSPTPAPAARGKGKKTAAAVPSASGFWWSCNGYPACTASFGDGAEPDREHPRIGGAKPSINDPGAIAHPGCAHGGVLVRREGQHGAWYGCSAWARDGKGCDARFQEVEGAPDFASAATAAAAKANGVPCPRKKCKGTLVQHAGRDGRSPWWGCSDYRASNCPMKLDDVDGRPDIAALDGPPCPECGPKSGGVMMPRNGAKGKFWACNRYPKCKTSREDSFEKPAVHDGIQRGIQRSNTLI